MSRTFNGLLLSALLMMSNSFGAELGKLFSKGNKALSESRYEDAAEIFAEASMEAPESAEALYNLGCAQFRSDRFEEAAESFEYAASMAETDALRSRCWYNLGNCLVRTGETMRETEPQVAKTVLLQASWLYRTALDNDPSNVNAAYNLEITQRLVLEIESQIEEQQQKEQQQNELIKYIREKLQEFIERQTTLIQAKDTGPAQAVLERETRELAKMMEESGLHKDIVLPDESTMQGPLKETYTHTVNAANAMAVPDQPVALSELVAALGAAPEDPNKQEDESDENSEDSEDYDMDYEESDEEADMYEEADPFGDFSEYEEIRGVPPPNQTEMDILAEEIRNQERRKQKKAGEYKAAEKDW